MQKQRKIRRIRRRELAEENKYNINESEGENKTPELDKKIAKAQEEFKQKEQYKYVPKKRNKIFNKDSNRSSNKNRMIGFRFIKNLQYKKTNNGNFLVNINNEYAAYFNRKRNFDRYVFINEWEQSKNWKIPVTINKGSFKFPNYEKDIRLETILNQQKIINRRIKYDPYIDLSLKNQLFNDFKKYLTDNNNSISRRRKRISIKTAYWGYSEQVKSFLIKQFNDSDLTITDVEKGISIIDYFELIVKKTKT